MISVKDRLPELTHRREATSDGISSSYSDDVLCYDETSGQFAVDSLYAFDGEEPKWSDRTGDSLTVTHWTPLPLGIYGIQFPNGHWLVNPEGIRIIGHTKEEAQQILNRWNAEGGAHGGQITLMPFD